MERPKRGWFGSGLKSDVVLPPVGPAFVTMDDAARYAHRQIGSRRDKEYGGVILESLADGYFYATEPIAGGAYTFDYWTVLKVDSNSQYLHPQGYRCVADYHSHPDAFDDFQENNPEFSERQVRGLNGFFSDIDLSIFILERGFFSASYLSGPDGGLLKYVTTGSAEEQRFGVWLDKKLHFGHADGPADNKPETFFKKAASVSQLSIVVPSALWGGSTGTVPRQWRPFTAFVSRTYELPACGPVYAGLDALLEVLQQRNPERAFILKDANKEDYVLVEPPAGGPAPVSIQQLFPRTSDGKRVSHESFHWVAVYLGRPPVPLRLPSRDAWLYRNFFSPLELATQLYHGVQSRDLLGPERQLFFYRNLNDGALLQYKCAFSTAETELFRVEPDGQVVDNQIDSALLAGTLSPRDFVLRVAAGGYLSVIRAGKIWDRLGPVDAQWRAVSRVPKPVLSPPFVTADDAARWAHNRIGERRDKEYGGAVLRQGARYFATEPVAGASIQFDFRAIMATDEHDYFIAPAPFDCYAFYHSHPAGSPGEQGLHTQFTADEVEIFISFFSSADQAFVIGNREFAPAHYLSGPQGSLLKYVSSGSMAEQTLLKQLTGEMPIQPVTEFEGTVWNFADAGDLRVVLANRVWGGARGRVARGWRVGEPVIPKDTVQEQPFFTPQANTGQVAALIALNHINGMPAGAYQGFVLKHQNAPSYIATLPVAAGTTLASLFPARADGQAKLPSNYRLVGLYRNVFASEPRPLPANEAWLYKRFAPPALWVEVMTQALATSKLQIAGLGLKLYLQAPDRALLHWQVPSADTANELFSVAGQRVTDKGNQAALLDGTLSSREFVHRVIRAGELTVIQQGDLWNVLGPMHDGERLPLGSGTTLLSAAFLTADDAARLAHEKIGFRRGTAFGGYILKRPDGRFLFTEPVTIHGDGFSSDLLLPRPGGGLLVPPVGHEIHGRYASHGAVSFNDLARQRRLDWTLADLEVNATMFSDVEIRAVIESRLPAYLSGSPNNLIGYTPSGSANELLVLSNTTREPGQHGYFERLETGKLKPVDIVTRLADAGNLQVLVGSQLWGPRGTVYDDWTPNFEYAQIDLQTPAFGAIFNSQDAAALNAHIRWYGRNLDAQAATAYILKHPQHEEYVVSELLPIKPPGRWLSDSSRGFGYLTGGDFAKGFVLKGLLYSQQWLPVGLNTSEAWLTQFFVTPELLLRAEEDARHLPRSSAGPAVLPVYVSTLDGALLRYQPQASSMLKQGIDGAGVTIQGMSLHDGSLDIRRFVTLIAKAGDLRVLYSSQCWDRRGLVIENATLWRPYGRFTRRRLGPAFQEQDDAVRHARSRLGDHDNGLLGGLVLKRPDGLFVATEPLKVPREDFDPKWIFPDEVVSVGGFPAGHTIVARYRTSAARELPFALEATQKSVYRNMLSTRVIGASLQSRDVHLTREYLLGTDGCVLSYTRSRTALEDQLKTALQPLQPQRAELLDNLVERQMRDGTLTPIEFVTRLAQAGTLRVVDGSVVWGMPRTVTAPFVANVIWPEPLLIRNAVADPPFSPLFTQEQDAVRYAHEQCRPGESLQFGYVFKSPKLGLYMVSMPLVRASYRDYSQVFPQGLLPQGYALEGLYLCATNELLTPAEDPLHQAFFLPTDFDTGLRFSQHAVKDKKLRLYLSCPDGALLRYQYLSSDEQLDTLGSLQVLREQLLLGNARMLDHVRSLVARGNLDVLIEGRVWAGTTRVSSDWQPGTGPGFEETWRACGPLFSHADDAARDVQRRLAPYRGQEYLAAILGNRARTSFVATLPRVAGLDTAQQLALFYTGPDGPVQPLVQPTEHPVPEPVFPTQYQVVAAQLIYGAMPPSQSNDPQEQRLLNNFVGPALLSLFLRVLRAYAERPASLYLSVREGALLKYIPSFSQMEDQIQQLGVRLQPSEFLKRVTGYGQLFVLDRDALWRNEGRTVEAQVDPRNQTEETQIDEALSIRDRDEL
ncbi:DUF4329 domain-containing protein [Pseudomonas sp. WS 5111]|jgi:proteasome lid subunit RPN8/RPN11|uniref:DUF4329 domain-containing protein n=1 Tax=unclassified Pseudomonas TaxID=196821 RepID=UPI0014760D98|nr:MULTISPECIES: DUF4329 domain-containing protein [unclassified Pseudomonas]NMX66419.1 DUF4329 domain-containing protein [Pseudomonas sp. WS 5111]NMX87965.1 DUF4329 domain-containing protein [Pseudomonas sp. WS 5010]